jgi:hypothetical protein
MLNSLDHSNLSNLEQLYRTVENKSMEGLFRYYGKAWD